MLAMCLLRLVWAYCLCGLWVLPPFTGEGELFCGCYLVFKSVERIDLVRISGCM